jgi:SAM-dependent methyltransferase
MHESTLYDLPALYDLVVRTGPCEAFYRDVARRTGGPILELACGTGRLTIPLARDGHEVVALDASPLMVRSARAKAEAEMLQVTFIQGDIRDFDLGQRFPLVILCCNSLGHLTTNEDLIAGLRCISRHLAPGGLFAFDVVNPDLKSLSQPEAGCVRLDQGPNPSSGIAIEEMAAYDPVQQIRVSRLRVVEPDMRRREIAPLSLRLFFPQELPLALHAAGLELAARYGDFAGNPLTAEGLNQICLARGAPAQSSRLYQGRTRCQPADDQHDDASGSGSSLDDRSSAAGSFASSHS